MNAVDGHPHLRVLVVDDEALIRWSVVEQLSEHGHDMSEAADGRTAIEGLREGPSPDVVLLDFRLPDSNDLDLLKRIRALAPNAAVIMMTAFGTPEVIQGALDLGVYRVLNKPFDITRLDAVVLAAHSAHRA